MKTNHTNLSNVSLTPAVRSNFFESPINLTETNNILITASTEPKMKYAHKPFIEANTLEVSLAHLQNDCIIPVFADNEKIISHQEFIECVLNCVQKVYPFEKIASPEIRVSHTIKGRTSDALHKSTKDLLESEQTRFYERLAFIIEIPSITSTIDGNELSLTVGGVRSLNNINLFNKKGLERFTVFAGFKVLTCCNMKVSTDGLKSEIKTTSIADLQEQIISLLSNYNASKHLFEMSELVNHHLTEQQFAQLLGKAKLYNFLPKDTKVHLPQLSFTDSQFNTIAKDYYADESFCKSLNGDINLWKILNLFTQANKSSYIDSFIQRDLNAFQFSKGIQKALIGNGDYHWFLS